MSRSGLRSGSTGTAPAAGRIGRRTDFSGRSGLRSGSPTGSRREAAIRPEDYVPLWVSAYRDGFVGEGLAYHRTLSGFAKQVYGDGYNTGRRIWWAVQK